MSIFKNKEHYLAFRNAWSAAVQSDRAKSKVVDKTFRCSSNGGTTIIEYREREKGWLQAEHFLLYNYCRQRPLYTGFTPIHDKVGLINGWNVNNGLYQAAYNLRHLIRNAKAWVKDHAELELTPDNVRPRYSRWNEFVHRQCENFLEPFDGTITLEMLATVEIPEVDQLNIFWPYHTELVNRIIAGERFTMEELWPNMIRENRT